MSQPLFDLIGVGNPIMDLLAPVPESFLTEAGGAKGGMVHVDSAEIGRLVAKLDAPPTVIPGGSVANTIVGAARLGLSATYLGKIGHDDTARAYHAHFVSSGADGARFKHGALPNGRCLALVTPDGQRTLRTFLGAAISLHPDEISAEDFRGVRHAHIEGYLLFNPALAEKAVSMARAAGCTVSIDLASFEVVKSAREWIFAQLRAGLHAVFANEDEARALFADGAEYPELARRLAGYGGIAAVKLGKDGAWIAQDSNLHRIEPVTVPHVVDTTGAGDAWAAGFLFGWLRGASLPAAGAIGSLLGAETVQHLGPAIPETRWPALRRQADRIASDQT
ncbi:MAG: adenosine kinase [Opitutaceae bacterium]|nr:adenosine kinase [Opitutaceae bacterium]